MHFSAKKIKELVELKEEKQSPPEKKSYVSYVERDTSHLKPRAILLKRLLNTKSFQAHANRKNVPVIYPIQKEKKWRW